MIIWSQILKIIKAVLKAMGLRFFIGFLLGAFLYHYTLNSYFKSEIEFIERGREEIKKVKEEALKNKEELVKELETVRQRKKEIEDKLNEDIINPDADLDAIINKHKPLFE